MSDLRRIDTIRLAPATKTAFSSWQTIARNLSAFRWHFFAVVQPMPIVALVRRLHHQLIAIIFIRTHPAGGRGGDNRNKPTYQHEGDKQSDNLLAHK